MNGLMRQGLRLGLFMYWKRKKNLFQVCIATRLAEIVKCVGASLKKPCLEKHGWLDRFKCIDLCIREINAYCGDAE